MITAIDGHSVSKIVTNKLIEDRVNGCNSNDDDDDDGGGGSTDDGKVHFVKKTSIFI